MKITQDIGIRICGTGSSVPERKISNDDMATIVETNDEWIRTRTGISNRHFADKETNLSLGMEAAEKALEMAGISKEEIGVVICATITPDNIVPSQACMLQKELGLPETVFAFDICAACTGFLYAVHTARSLLCSMPEKKYALVVASEVLSRVTNFADRNTCVLFGDGAGAAVITLDENSRYAFDCGAEGNTEVLYCPKYYHDTNPFAENLPELAEQFVSMQGRAVYSFSVQALSGSIQRVAEKVGGYPDCYVCHQANARILQAAAKQLKEPMEKFFLNIGEYGNTSAASIAIALDDCVRRQRKTGTDHDAVRIRRRFELRHRIFYILIEGGFRHVPQRIYRNHFSHRQPYLPQKQCQTARNGSTAGNGANDSGC